jgi:hypothetical protein
MLRKKRKTKRMDFLYLIKIRATNSGRTAEESGINSGNWYNSNFDKLHNIAVTSSYNLNEKWSFEPTLHCKQDNLAFQMANMNT